MSQEESAQLRDIESRLNRGKNLSYRQRMEIVEQIEDILVTTGFQCTWRALLIKAFRNAFGGI